MDETTLVDEWVQFIHGLGRVPTQMPPNAPPALADPTIVGDLASRLSTPDPTLGSGPAQWDYELAPPPLVDAWKSPDPATQADLGQALVDASNAYVTAGQGVTSFLSDLPTLAATTAGTVVHKTAQTLWEFVGSALGFSPWWLVGTAGGIAALVLFTDRGTAAARRATRAGGEIARAAL